MFFLILCFDRPGAGELREKTRPAHLQYLADKKSVMHLGGPMESDEGAIVGTIFVVDVENRAAAVSFTEEEPFHKAGVFESVLVRRWRQMQPEVVPGVNQSTEKEGLNQLKEEGQPSL